MLLGLAALTGHVHRDPGAPRPALDQDEGRDERVPASHRPTIESAFAAESYRPGATARLVLFDAAPRLRIRIFRVGDGHGLIGPRDVMRGDAVGRSLSFGRVSTAGS